MQEPIAISETPPLPGLAMVQQANAAMATIATDFAGPADPAALAGPFMKWADTGAGLIKRRNAAGTAWVVEGALNVSNLGIYQVGSLPALDIGPVYTTSVGPMEWDGTKYVRMGGLRISTFTANGSFVVPAGQYQIFAAGAAGGGGGGGAAGYVANYQLHGAGGGSGESRLWTAVTVTPGEMLTIEIGAGGSVGTGGSPNGAGNNGGAGGATRILRSGTPILTLAAGSGGAGGASAGPAGGGNGFPRGGDGMAVINNSISTNLYLAGGAGASSLFGVGAASVVALSGAVNGSPGSGYGAGGGGGAAPVSNTSSSGGNGAAGRPGVLLLAW